MRIDKFKNSNFDEISLRIIFLIAKALIKKVNIIKKQSNEHLCLPSKSIKSYPKPFLACEA